MRSNRRKVIIPMSVLDRGMCFIPKSFFGKKKLRNEVRMIATDPDGSEKITVRLADGKRFSVSEKSVTLVRVDLYASHLETEAVPLSTLAIGETFNLTVVLPGLRYGNGWCVKLRDLPDGTAEFLELNTGYLAVEPNTTEVRKFSLTRTVEGVESCFY